MTLPTGETNVIAEFLLLANELERVAKGAFLTPQELGENPARYEAKTRHVCLRASRLMPALIDQLRRDFNEVQRVTRKRDQWKWRARKEANDRMAAVGDMFALKARAEIAEAECARLNAEVNVLSPTSAA